MIHNCCSLSYCITKAVNLDISLRHNLSSTHSNYICEAKKKILIRNKRIDQCLRHDDNGIIK